MVWRRVLLHGPGRQRFTQVEENATKGAVLGKNLYRDDGTLITEEDLGGGSSTDETTNNSLASTLWRLILEVPAIVKSLIALNNPGYIYHNGTVLTAHEWPLHDTKIESGETLVITAGKQYLIWGEIDAEGDIEVLLGGDLVIFDEGQPKAIGPDFTYTTGDLSQIDYDGGEQKLFTYNGSGDLTRVDFIQDGLTLRKDLFYSAGDLDYIDEYYV